MKAQGILVLLVSVGVGITAFACSSSKDTNTGNGGGATSAGGGGPVTVTSTKSAALAGTGGAAPTALGTACTVDSDCGAGTGLKCSTPDMDDPVFGGGAPSGYCTKTCTANNDCPTGGKCVGGTPGGAMECLLTCTIGPATMYLDEPLDPNKCQGRADLRCDSSAVCVPSCGEDSQCNPGRVCDPRSSACVDTGKVTMGDKLGAACVGGGGGDAGPTCAGTCIDFGKSMVDPKDMKDVAMCSSPCTSGVAMGDSLSTTTNCGGIDNGLCAFLPMSYGAGDTAYCTPACKTQGDCLGPDFWCGTLNGQTNNGYCSGGNPACPHGASDCIDPKTNMAVFPNATCTPTKYGSFCIDPAWPLGTAGGSGGAGGAGAGGAAAAGAGGTGGTIGTGGKDGG